MAQKRKSSAPKKKRRCSAKPAVNRSFRRFCFIVIFIIFFWWYNNFTLKITETSMTSPKISTPIRAAVFSDLHITGASFSSKKIIGALNDIDPDIVFILGDMYTMNSDLDTIEKAADFITDIAAAGFSVYFVPGEHDTSPQYFSRLASSGVHVMTYRSEMIEINGERLNIIGIDNAYYTSTFDLHNEFEPALDCFNILLAHIPNYTKFANFKADLTLCADTHGGMAQLPFGLGAVYDPLTGRWFPKLASSDPVYDKGWFDYSGGSMFITSGLGNNPVPLRLFNRPEIVSIEIVPQ